MSGELDEAKDKIIEQFSESLTDIWEIVTALCDKDFADTPQLRNFKEQIGDEVEYLRDQMRWLEHKALIAKTIQAGKAKAGR